MPLTISITGYVPPVGVPLTLAALRKLATGFTVSISGTVSGGEVVDGSITPAKVSPGAYFYGVATFDGIDTYSVTLSPPLSAYAAGVRVFFKAPAANPDATTYLKVNGLAKVAIVKRGYENLWGGEIAADQIIEVIYNSSLAGGPCFEMQSNGVYPRRNYALTTGTVASNRCTAFVLSTGINYDTVGSYSAQVFFARLHADCNANPTMNLGVGTAYPLTWLDGRAIAQSQLRKGQVIGFVFDSALAKFTVLGEQPSGLFGAANTGTANAWIASIPGFPESPVAGMAILIKAPAANTQGVTLTVSSPTSATTHASIAVVKHGNRSLQAGDTKANAYYVVVYDGTNYVLQTPTAQPVVMAMANFDGNGSGTLTPRDSYNVDGTTKITRHGTGDYTINFATALPSANYQVHITIGSADNASNQGIVWTPGTYQTAGSVRIHTGLTSGSAADFSYIYVTVIGYP